MGKEKNEVKKAQEIQNEIFRKMSAERKLDLMNSFFHFAKKLNTLGKKYGANGASQKNRESFGKA